MHFIGPLLPEPDPAHPPLAAGRTTGCARHPGHGRTDPDALLVPAVRALAGGDWHVLVTSGAPPADLLERLGEPPGPDVRVERFVPYAQVLDHVDVLITNGGYGTIQQALAHSVPIVVAGATEDKPEVAARVAWSGAGIRIASGRPRPHDVAEAATRALRIPGYRERARAIAREMREHDAPRMAADLLEQLVLAREPLTRTSPLTEVTR